MRENPSIREFLDFENGLNQYIGRLEANEQSWWFSANFYFYQLLLDCVFIQISLAAVGRQLLEIQGTITEANRALTDDTLLAIQDVTAAVKEEGRLSREENSALQVLYAQRFVLHLSKYSVSPSKTYYGL